MRFATSLFGAIGAVLAIVLVALTTTVDSGRILTTGVRTVTAARVMKAFGSRKAEQSIRTADELKRITAAGDIAILKFGAKWCRPCAAIDPAFHSIAKANTNPHLHFLKVDVDASPALATLYGVKAFPTFAAVSSAGVGDGSNGRQQRAGGRSLSGKGGTRNGIRSSSGSDTNVPRLLGSISGADEAALRDFCDKYADQQLERQQQQQRR